MGFWKTLGKVARPITPLKWLTSPFEGMYDRTKAASSSEYDDGRMEHAADEAEIALREGDRHMGLIPLLGTAKGVMDIGQDVAAWGSRNFGDGDIKSTDQMMDDAVARTRAEAAEKAYQQAQEEAAHVQYDENGNPSSVDPSLAPPEEECEPNQSIDPSLQ